MPFDLTCSGAVRRSVSVKRPGWRTGTILGLWLAAALCLAPGLRAQSASQREYEIKAAYLYNFIKYVDWPSYGDTITIGVLGYDPFGTALAPLNGKLVKGRRLAIKHLDSVRDAQQCQIIFVSSSE